MRKMIMSTTAEQSSQFFQQWQIYRHVIEHNYMFHHEIAEQLSRLLEGCDQHISVLDLGCGDSEMFSRIKQPSLIHHYTGIDMSAMAIELAKKRLQAQPFEGTFILDDFAHYLEHCNKHYDVILAGFTLHHLSQADKESFFKHARRKLSSAPYAQLIIYDVVKANTETRDQFIERMCDYFQQHWQAFDQQQLASIKEHVRNNDQPEDMTFYQHCAKQYGFKQVNSHYRSPDEFYSLIRFQ